MLQNDPYPFPDEDELSSCYRPLIDAERALAAADARIGGSQQKSACLSRLKYLEATRLAYNDGIVVPLDDLVRLDAGLGHGLAVSMDTSRCWAYLNWLRDLATEHAAYFLATDQPGERVVVSNAEIAAAVRRDPLLLADPNWDTKGRLDQWRAVLRQTEDLPPLLAAAVAWDSWHVLEPNEGNGSRRHRDCCAGAQGARTHARLAVADFTRARARAA